MELEHVSCDLCGSDRYRERYRKPDDFLWRNQYAFPVVECLSCGLVFVNPRPTFSEMAYFYPSGYHESRDTTAHLARYARQFEYIDKLPCETMLDIGCAQGDWLAYVGKVWPRIEMHGIDAFSSGVILDKINFQKCALPQAKLPANHFDVITSWAVLEHVHTPLEYFRAVARVLKRRGKFVFLVTNAESLYGRRGFSEDIPRHLYHFSEMTLLRYASETGLKLERVDYDDSLWDGRGWGTFRYTVAKLCGFSWEKLNNKQLSRLAKVGLRAGAALDRIVFSTHWESRLRRSGIIVVTMSKQVAG